MVYYLWLTIGLCRLVTPPQSNTRTPTVHYFKSFVAYLLILTTTVLQAESNWPMAGGPGGTWKVEGPEPPLEFSVRADRNIQWKTSLPEGGQSGIAVFGRLAFLTIMKPWIPQHNPDLLRAQQQDIVDAHAALLKEVDKELLDFDSAFATTHALYASNSKQIEEHISKRVDMAK